MKRIVQGEIRCPDETPWKGAEVQFVLSPGSYTSSVQYPQKLVKVITNELGKFSIALWTNEEGKTPSRYICRYPSGEPFEFTLPVGDTPVQISLLRDKESIVRSPQYPALLSDLKMYVRQLVESVQMSAGVAKILSGQYTASQNLSALRALALNASSAFVYASSSNLEHAYSVVGVLDISAVAGESIKAIAEGPLTDSSWNWQPNLPIFLGVDGQLSQVAPTLGFLKQVATVVTPTQIYIDLQESILL